jgi:hypothetical protein
MKVCHDLPIQRSTPLDLAMPAKGQAEAQRSPALGRLYPWKRTSPALKSATRLGWNGHAKPALSPDGGLNGNAA